MFAGWKRKPCLYVLCFLCCCLVLLPVPAFEPHQTHPSEVSALEGVANSLIDDHKNLKGWKNGGDPCLMNWTGVICFGELGSDGYFHVMELLLMNLNLSGTLAPELGLLSQLHILNFMWNELTGSIPKEIGNIKSLQILVLNGNRLSGSLPDELGYLPNLNRFQICENQISGPIPKSFSNLNSIRHIHFNNNSLSGQLPPELSKLSTVHHLLFDNNNFSGNLPSEFSNLTTLKILQLDNNNFNGAEIPASYGNLSSLVKLSLRNCSLKGPFPDLRMRKLQYIDLSLNQLSGTISNILSNNITTIVLSHNKFSGSIPASFSSLPILQKLSLDNNFLTGSVNVDLWQDKSFSSSATFSINLANNSLSNVIGYLDPPTNVTIRLQGNPVCRNANIRNIKLFCDPESKAKVNHIWRDSKTNSSTRVCPLQACPTGNYFEYAPASPSPCFCASPLRIGYRLMSPSLSDFPPYETTFESYLATSLNLTVFQVFIDSFLWEGHRLRMYLKLFPLPSDDHLGTFNRSEVLSIRDKFTSWGFPGNELFGPYELLNFTLVGPYTYVNSDSSGKSKNKGILVAIILSMAFITGVISATATALIMRKRATLLRMERSRKRQCSTLSIKTEDVKSFTFEELALATNDFSESAQVGQGGYGKVYKGSLPDKTIVAIKRGREGSLQGKKEFLTEIELLSRLHHRNLVSLVGYCDEEDEQMLVYEFMPNGTLQDWLSAKSGESLDFAARLRIALEAAKGILYLHTEANPPIFHRDIKASNILLDSNLTAKVADFGISRLAPQLDAEGLSPQHVSTIVKGTPGYLDPEYLMTYQLTDKSDVYSIGIVFLELLTGKQPIMQGKNIVREVKLEQHSGKMYSVVDRRMGSYPCECVERFIGLGLKCCADKPDTRPSILDVVRELENIHRMMMPETGVQESSSDSPSRCFSKSSSLNSGGDLISAANLDVAPR
ncbi:OLC1v1004771C1 [Oldenlandia corymbosa var. corymbosa]|uniref:non-specific serine/threonine protein kinase n=1 Tax=Oldenlandia corymbosa var. corymbosa TaxID=529605 RepID=A0AAV1DFR4_OLDCO|nr:OLC1v1004771C1 [Oldenlandia corymbosa var. corymbosa]